MSFILNKYSLDALYLLVNKILVLLFGMQQRRHACRSDSRPGAIPPSMIPIPAHLFDSDSSHLGYHSDSNTIFMNDSDSDSSTPYLIVTPELYKF